MNTKTVRTRTTLRTAAALAFYVLTALAPAAPAQVGQTTTFDNNPMAAATTENSGPGGTSATCFLDDVWDQIHDTRTQLCGLQATFAHDERRKFYYDIGSSGPQLLQTTDFVTYTPCSCSGGTVRIRTTSIRTLPLETRVRYAWDVYPRTAGNCTQTGQAVSAYVEGCRQPLQVADCSCPAGYMSTSRDCETCVPMTPVLVDTAGDGVRLTSRAAGVKFDLAVSGAPQQLPWTEAGSDDAWLVLLKRDHAQIEDGSFLFGNMTDQSELRAGEEKNGYVTLRLLDRHGDRNGLLDDADPFWSRLRLWRDLDHDGVSRPAEIFTLDSFGITALELDYKESGRRDRHGNQLRYRAKVRTRSGQERFSYDALLTAEK